jgi:2-isopropylmalate synthase
LPIDPKHVGRTYEAVVRVNSQSGKGGVAYIMETEYGMVLPRRLQIEFSKTIQTITEDTGTEISPADMWKAFEAEYFPPEPRMQFLSHEAVTDEAGAKVTVRLHVDGQPHSVTGQGNGPIAAFVHGLKQDLGVEIDIHDYAEHAVSAGSSARAAAYVEARAPDGTIRWGVGTDESIVVASLKAVIGAINRLRTVGSVGRIEPPAMLPR